MNIIEKKYWYFFFSLLIIIPGIISLIVWGLRLSIDLTGGARIIYKTTDSKHKISNNEFNKIFNKEGVEIGLIQESEGNTYIIRTKPIGEKKHQKIKENITKNIKGMEEIGFEEIGPTIGAETTANAFKGVIFACVLIVLYLAWSFRKVPKPASSFRFGICAVVALIHDVLVVVGVFSLLGHFLHVEVDSLFITALLTIIGFSVHDTIVVFDRIRENLGRMVGVPFDRVVNESILQTLGRSLNTSLTVLLVLFTMFLFGGESIKWFVIALLIGITSGTYSSIFNAAPLLVVWEEWSRRKANLKN